MGYNRIDWMAEQEETEQEETEGPQEQEKVVVGSIQEKRRE